MLAALGLFVVLRLFVVEAFSIPSGSMQPTLHEGDFLFANKLSRTPSRGDLVIFRSPIERDVTAVKRVVGVPGDTIAMQGGILRVNDTAQPEPYAISVEPAVDPEDPQMRAWQRRYLAEGDVAAYRPTLRTWGPLVVPPDSFFVLGDNRDNSLDSRYWGFLGGDRIRGRPVFIYYSYDPDADRRLRLLTTIRWGRLFDRPR